jgi:hypothetical protein
MEIISQKLADYFRYIFYIIDVNILLFAMNIASVLTTPNPKS